MADSHDEHVPTGPARAPGMLANILAIVGFLILIIIVIWGVLHIISLSSPWFSGMFSGKKEITVTLPPQAPAAQPFTVSWKYSTGSRGTYAILYQCVEGLKMSVDGNAIPCGAAYTLGNATGTATMIPTLSGTTSVQTEISVLFIPSAAGTTGPEATGSAKIHVYKGSPVTQQPQPTENTNTNTNTSNNQTGNANQNSQNNQITNTNTNSGTHATPKPTYVPRPVTPADLSVRIVAVGVIDQYTGAFVARAPYNQGEVSAVQFDIANVGGSASGSYTFQAQIPTTQPYTYASPVQPSLAPGAHVVNTLRFTPAVDGTFSVQVYGSDARTSNNHASQWVTGGYQYPQYQYPYGYPYQY